MQRGTGHALAAKILSSGRALDALERIVDLQGRHDRPSLPGDLVHEVSANQSGFVEHIDSAQISGIARAAGAPMDKSAGIDLLVRTGDAIDAGDPLYLIHGNVENDVQIAVKRSQMNTGVTIK